MLAHLDGALMVDRIETGKASSTTENPLECVGDPHSFDSAERPVLPRLSGVRPRRIAGHRERA